MRPIDLVKKVCHSAKPSYLTAIQNGDALFAHYGITTPKRLTQFLAECLAETGGLVIEWESGNYSAERLVQIFGPGHHNPPITANEAQQLQHNAPAIFERVYGMGSPEKAKELGNLKPGDAYRLRGGGMMQTTGGDNYRRIGTKIGIDLYVHPEWVLDQRYALMPALIEWDEDHLNTYADIDDTLAIARAINLGNPHSSRMPNGWTDRQDWLHRLVTALGNEQITFNVPAVPVSPIEVPPKPSKAKGAAAATAIAAVGAAGASQTTSPALVIGIIIAAVAVGALVWYLVHRHQTNQGATP